MSSNRLTSLRKYATHLLRSSPERVAEAAEDHPLALTLPPEVWVRRLTEEQLTELCRRWVRRSVMDFADEGGAPWCLVRAVLALPGEFTLDDARTLAPALDETHRDELQRDIAKLLFRLVECGLVEGSRTATHFQVPLAVQLHMDLQMLLEEEAWSRLRPALVRHFAEVIARNPAPASFTSTPAHVVNPLFAVHAAAMWLEELRGLTIRELLEEEPGAGGDPVPDELVRGLVSLARGLASSLVDRPTHKGARLLGAMAIGARLAGETRLEADTLKALGRHYRLSHQADEALRAFEAARRVYQLIPDMRLVVLTTCALAFTLRDTDRPAQAIEQLERAWMLSNEHEIDAAKVATANCCGEILLATGDPAKARHWFRRGWKVSEHDGETPERAELALNIGRAYLAEDISDEAEEWLLLSLGMAQACGRRGVQADALTELGNLRRSLGDPGAALLRYREALPLRRTEDNEEPLARLLLSMARCALDNGRLDDGARFALEGQSCQLGHGHAKLIGELVVTGGLVAEKRGDLAGALRAMQVGLRYFGNGRAATEAAQTHVRAGLLHRERGDAARAAWHFFMAQGISREHQLAGLLAELTPPLTQLIAGLAPEEIARIVENVGEELDRGALGSLPGPAAGTVEPDELRDPPRPPRGDDTSTTTPPPEPKE